MKGNDFFGIFIPFFRKREEKEEGEGTYVRFLPTKER